MMALEDGRGEGPMAADGVAAVVGGPKVHGGSRAVSEAIATATEAGLQAKALWVMCQASSAVCWQHWPTHPGRHGHRDFHLLQQQQQQRQQQGVDVPDLQQRKRRLQRKQQLQHTIVQYKED